MLTPQPARASVLTFDDHRSFASAQLWMKQSAFQDADRVAGSRGLDAISRLLFRLGRTATATHAQTINYLAPHATQVVSVNAALLQRR